VSAARAPTNEVSCADVLRAAGAIVIPGAVDQRICAGLIDDLQTRPAVVTRPISPTTMTREPDPEFVQSKTVAPSPFSQALVEFALEHHRSELQRFFGRPLELNPELHFVTYGPGGFIRPHRDVMDGEGVLETIRERIVVFTLFLNGAAGPDGHEYEGGDFVLHPSADRRLVLPCMAGMLVAFRADVAHSVRAVSAGTRHAVTGWFRKPPAT
jgi:predicted 2-oxoglutarate/Fe(II)-dependent dioxygenase YbiX